MQYKQPILCFFVVICMFAFQNYCQAEGQPPIPVYGAFCLSGSGAEWGKFELDGANLAIDQANASSKGVRYKLKVEDTKTSNQGTVTAVLKLLTDGATAIVGPSWIDAFQGVLPIAEKKKILLITPSSVVSAYKSKREALPLVYNTWNDLDSELSTLVSHLKQNGVQSISLYTDDDLFCETSRATIERQLQKNAIKILEQQHFQPDLADFKPSLLKTKSLGGSKIFFCSLSESSLLNFLRQRSELLPQSSFYCTEFCDTFLSNPERRPYLVNGSIIFPRAKSEVFFRDFKARYGYEANFAASNTFDAVNILIAGYQSGARTPETLKKFFDMSSFDTATFGKVKFNELGAFSGGRYQLRVIGKDTVETKDLS